ncbi:hypothetical protein BGX20_004225, partial [Mortierella sp. AD010]
MTKHYSHEVKARVVGMAEAHMKGSEISKITGIPSRSVNQIISNFKVRGTTARPKALGQPRVLDDRDLREIHRHIDAERDATLTDITNQLPKKVSEAT